MPGSLETRENGHVVYIKFSSPLTVADLASLFQQDKAHRDKFQKEHPGGKVHLVADAHELTTVPPGLLKARQSPSLNHPTKGQIAVIGAQRFVQTISETIFRLTRFDQAEFFESDEDAMVYIRKVIANGDKPVK